MIRRLLILAEWSAVAYIVYGMIRDDQQLDRDIVSAIERWRDNRDSILHTREQIESLPEL